MKSRPATFFNRIGLIRKNDWAFKQRGDSGLWVSDLFPHLATVADDLTVIKSMVADSANHTPATFQQNTGFQLNGFPVMGSWISYGLGSETEDLPAYVVLPDARGYPAGGTINWSNGSCRPCIKVSLSTAKARPFPTSFLQSPFYPAPTSLAAATGPNESGRPHTQRREDGLLARIRSHELAARMQLTVPEVVEMADETEATQRDVWVKPGGDG